MQQDVTNYVLEHGEVGEQPEEDVPKELLVNLLEERELLEHGAVEEYVELALQEFLLSPEDLTKEELGIEGPVVL